ncbi:response regulator [Methylobacterium dankookense]|uniref:C4-dicarboxylate transport transcriptional regulatory protein DctD n=1 Tax=Methylobacterium dankookense TaxID=560405 RepID=A0A564G5L5_9HYPH|nr:response regulator [Methylobacterium dankookense]GJD56500.1 C4-dicarboxylate transport transcriptional regulatory protein DctD [Methylobacterium dankookense]VUF15296.1 C4-dicarboxylate transport transcriptional regulatory protein DctD [Methylobacterium dankookense]
MPETPPEQPVVLLVEDDGLLLMEASDTLSDAGFTVLEAPHADKALKVLENRDDVGILMTDVDMPQGSMDGFALARLVADRWPSIPVLIVSGMGTPGPDDMPDGARFIPKPYEPTTLVRTLRAFARRAA